MSGSNAQKQQNMLVFTQRIQIHNSVPSSKHDVHKPEAMAWAMSMYNPSWPLSVGHYLEWKFSKHWYRHNATLQWLQKKVVSTARFDCVFLPVLMQLRHRLFLPLMRSSLWCPILSTGVVYLEGSPVAGCSSLYSIPSSARQTV